MITTRFQSVEIPSEWEFTDRQTAKSEARCFQSVEIPSEWECSIKELIKTETIILSFQSVEIPSEWES
jgi:hypothetical protein